MGLFKFSKTKDIILSSPLRGKVVPLSEVPDPTFAQGMLGDGVAIIPDGGCVYSPADGSVISIADTKHAIMLLCNEVELLIHVGIDTVKLSGRCFEVCKDVGEKISIGDALLKFDKQAIIDSGYNTVTPIIISNSSEFSSIDILANYANINEPLIKLIKK